MPKPRALKDDAEKFLRKRTIAEVFTPSHVVKQMIDAIDDGQIDSTWLEIACGEAPFITNRYDAESGDIIARDQRTGILDRKLSRIPAAVDKFTWASHAVQSVYGCELQDDSLLIARANVLLTVAEFVEDITAAELEELAEIISCNFWRTDILKPPQLSLFEATDWNTGDEFFLGGTDMKFDFVIGNPPYQDDTIGDNKTFAPPVYNKFMDAAYKAGVKVELITPARFLFDAGATPKDFNRRMLNDPHLKVIDYAPKATKYFKGVDIKGGVAITLHDETRTFKPIGTFIPFEQLKTIHQKVVVDDKNFRPFNEIIYSRTIYRLTEKVHKDFPGAKNNLSNGHLYDMSTNIFNLLPYIFFDVKPDDGHEYIQILGLLKMRRAFKWIRRDYVNNPEPLTKFKVFVPAANGSGALGEVLSTPLVGSPLVGSTETFITVGAFDTRAEADSCIAYIRSKFCRVMLGLLKFTQHNTAETWAKVPMQDFNPATSDIDWGGDVDGQLYHKYKLTAAEIAFIETHVKEMT
ncbi:MAG: Eco57I restriction-modification methylase domain-containing protein [Quinella sp. 1Q5]|nr:Eco57I restriction-modification methylase domain-containing protein [Quinella sp. 1Q5]